MDPLTFIALMGSLASISSFIHESSKRFDHYEEFDPQGRIKEAMVKGGFHNRNKKLIHPY